MTEFDDQLRQGLSAEVGGWSPIPGGVRRAAVPTRRRPSRLQLSAAVVAVLLVIGGGVGVAMGLGGSGSGRSATLAAAASPTPSAGCVSPSDYLAPYAKTCLPESTAPSAALTLTPQSGCTVYYDPSPDPHVTLPDRMNCDLRSLPAAEASAQAEADAAAEAAAQAAASAAASAVATSDPTPRPATSGRPAACTAADLQLAVTTDKASYVQGEPMHIHVTSRASAPCQAAGVEIAVEAINDSTALWSTCNYAQLTGKQRCAAGLPRFSLQAGVTEAHDYSWDFQDAPAADDTPATFVRNSDLRVVYRLGQVTASNAVHLAAAPACAPDQVRTVLTAGAATYRPGQTAVITYAVTNNSATPCAVPGDPLQTPALDASGVTVWAGCAPAGLARGQLDCAYATPSGGFAPLVVTPGATVSRRQTWDLVRDGTADAGPAPVPAGVYTLHVAGGDGASTTVTVAN